MVELAVIGGGPAGLTASLKAHEEGVKEIVLIERGTELGGILPQCIHEGFGTFIFGESLTGPEFAQRYIDRTEKTDIKVRTNTMVIEIDSHRRITAVSPEGLLQIAPKALIVATGCRERTRSQILIPGDRPAGIFTAGVAQRYMNIEGVMPGKKVVILGSGDVGLIMARRFTLEGAEVEGVYEIMPRPGGLTRNVVQCLEDYDIPLHLSHTIVDIKGRKRVEGVTVAGVDGNQKPVKGTERYIPCDTVILSVGLIPENELSRMARIQIDSKTGGPIVDEYMETSVEGVFACGNVVHVYDLVDDVCEAAETAGRGAANHIKGKKKEKFIPVRTGRNVAYAVPQVIRGAEEDVALYLRVKEVEKNVKVVLFSEDVLVERREKIVKPPEMIKVKIPAEKLRLKPVKEIVVEVTR